MDSIEKNLIENAVSPHSWKSSKKSSWIDWRKLSENSVSIQKLKVFFHVSSVTINLWKTWKKTQLFGFKKRYHDLTPDLQHRTRKCKRNSCLKRHWTCSH